MHELKIQLKPFQDEFLFSEKRFPCLKAGIGTGKTMMLLLKIWKYCNDFPNSLALIVRKEFTDLKDSTIKDFQRYLNVTVGSDKDFKLPNKSIIMFRHGAEINVLKNVNLSIVGIEQAEEFETDETFQFLRDRLRREGAPFRQLCLIANACGHNWIWRMWKNNPPSQDYHLIEANTFANESNVPADFIADLKTMEVEAPNHYKQYVLNSDEEVDADDYLLTWAVLDKATKLELGNKIGTRILALDPARFGQDKTAFTIIEKKGINTWEQIFKESHIGKDLMWTVGRFVDLRREFRTQIGVVDSDGLGSGAADRLKEMSLDIVEFQGGQKAKKEEYYGNRRAEGFFKLKEMVENSYLKILPGHAQIDELLTIRYKYMSKGQKMIISKDEMRKEGIKSPDEADALMMAVSVTERTPVRNNFILQTPGRMY
ncbi:MAG: phage terminase large subunit [Candidatus Omnitrophota bacterium]